MYFCLVDAMKHNIKPKVMTTKYKMFFSNGQTIETFDCCYITCITFCKMFNAEWVKTEIIYN